MKLITSVAISAAGAWLAGTATAVVGLSALQSRLPAMMTRWLAAEPDFERALVLLGTGQCEPGDDRAERLRARLEAASGRPVVYVDVTVRPGTSARRAARNRELVRSFHADHVLDHDLDGDPEPGPGHALRLDAQGGPAGR
ncbi:hypothetical protein [Kocuria turfanensis]|uniref:Uncharacterized protein n=1 Tax=Kocuria turfanensis TaxID=388357 RepID=A0A512IHE1_9MICC|nr:hypothetical protein [Kocuria turfanensis]GEO97143.1 hypothetical protein KTU01_32660 [Kocuria turfanensis]